MSKILLIGPAGCGKTHRVLNDFEQFLRASDPLSPDAFFVVPSMEHTERVISLLLQRGVTGFFYDRVTTFHELMSRFFQVNDIPVISSLHRAVTVRQLLRSHAWEYFREVQEQPGFLNLILQFLTEVKEAGLLPPEFRSRMNALKSFEPAYAPKYEALAALYECYEEELQTRGLRDSQDALRIFRRQQERKKGGAGFRVKALWIDGFFDFSNLQREYLREISAVTDSITVALTREDGPGWEDAFEAVDKTRRDLLKAGFEEEKMKPHSYRTSCSSIESLRQHLFSGQKAACSSEGITVMEAVGVDGEIELIAREIHRLYAAGEYRYSDFAVLFRQIKSYAPVIAAIFERYGIPVEIHERERLKFSPWIGTVASLLSLFRNGWKREDLFAFLKSGYVRFSGMERWEREAWIAELEQRSFQEGVVESREAWLRDWKGRGHAGMAVFNRQKTTNLHSLAALEDQFRAAKTVEEHARIFRQAVYQTFQILDLREQNTPVVRRDAACAARFEALLDEMKNHLGRAPATALSLEQFADYFLGLAELDLYSVHERDKNRVQIYDVSLARQKEYKVVFVAGLLEKVFPMQVRENPLLSDWERKLVNGDGEPGLAEQLPRQSIEKLFFYFAVTRASERLYLSYPHLDFEGKESLPSFYLDEVKMLFNEPVVFKRQNLARPYPARDEAITLREKEAAFLGGLRHFSPKEALGDENFMTQGRALLSRPDSKRRLFAALKSIEAVLSDPPGKKSRFGEVTEISPTRLELYAKCPYRYFANRILKLKDPGEDITVMQKGNILHYVLQQYYDPRRRKSVSEKPEEFLQSEIEKGLERYPLIWSDVYAEALDRRELFEMLLFFIKDENERLQRSSFRPAHVEYSFGAGAACDAPAWEILVGKTEIKLQGRVDRIDVDRERGLAIAVDYKRSARFKASNLEIGTSLQLPLYLLAIHQFLKLKPFGGAIYSIRDAQRSGFYCASAAVPYGKEFSSRALIPDEAFQNVLDRALRFAGKFVRDLEARKIPVRPRDCDSFCPYKAVCRVEKWRLPAVLEEIRAADEAEGLCV